MSEDPEFTISSGNAFADLGFEDPETERVKARLAIRIVQIVEEHGWSPTQAAETLGIDADQIPKLVRGHLDGFTVDRLIRLLDRLDQDVTITVTPRSATRRRTEKTAVGTG